MCNHYFTWRSNLPKDDWHCGEVIVSVGTAEMVIGYAKTRGEYEAICVKYCSEC